MNIWIFEIFDIWKLLSLFPGGVWINAYWYTHIPLGHSYPHEQGWLRMPSECKIKNIRFVKECSTWNKITWIQSFQLLKLSDTWISDKDAYLGCYQSPHIQNADGTPSDVETKMKNSIDTCAAHCVSKGYKNYFNVGGGLGQGKFIHWIPMFIWRARKMSPPFQEVIVVSPVVQFQRNRCQIKDMDIVFQMIPHESLWQVASGFDKIALQS